MDKFGFLDAILISKYQEGYDDALDNISLVDIDIIKKSIAHYGKATQSVVCMEECSELVQAISKELRGKHDIRHLVEEIADVTICLETLKEIYGIDNSDVQDWIEQKQTRMIRRMANDKY